MSKSDSFEMFAGKMRGKGHAEAAIRAFKNSYECLTSGETGMIPENTIQAVESLPRLEEFSKNKGAGVPISQAVVVKLNGGLGTSMGLDRAKSLLRIKDDLTFMDIIARQILHLREKYRAPLRFLLMNSFSTSSDTIDFLRKYPSLGEPKTLEFMQSAVPKVDAATMKPVEWPDDPELEWCPPGHGDIYPSLLGSGLLDQLLAEGVKFMFVSNSDNLGASLDLDLLNYFAASDQSFLMEVCERTASDRKGGHLAKQDKRLVLRESAQCPEPDQNAFQDISRHRFFNTNNLWVRLDHLKELLDKNGGFIPLPIIKNAKTVDPRDKNSTKVLQLETAMGAAIGCFEKAGAVAVPRTRFAPVKTTSDLLALRSDAYRVTEDWRLELAPECNGVPPKIDLDGAHYRMVEQLDAALREAVPSLKDCQELGVKGPVGFEKETILRGRIEIVNASDSRRSLPAGEYRDCRKEL